MYYVYHIQVKPKNKLELRTTQNQNQINLLFIGKESGLTNKLCLVDKGNNI